ncbi:D-alanyl-D-alanine carboxypeptidase family protein [Ostreiculturibacter nitratireducens]|uniref:D-alanyl-D-alanine carboxypeptidase family protein n=1 Tax=Ostreiculturibacter nitratireducens TaxID=3075226 RepID=UPI0031B5829A
MTALFGQWVRHGLFVLSFYAFSALAALAAPYADYVIDVRTGEVLHSENADTRLHPASLTKMMTLYIAFEAIEHGEISLDTMVTISKHAASEPPSKLGLQAGQKIALRYLIRAAAVKSANDAATAIGEAIAGSEAAFARRMNRTAKALGMSRTTFKNANGLTEEGHLSTARDMTTLGRHLFYDYPQYYNLFSRRSADAGIAQVASTNRRFLAAYEGADGIKTGYTSAAGFNLVASAQRGDKRIIATVFGGRSTAARNARVAELLDVGFKRAPNRARVQKPSPPQYVPGELVADALDATRDDPLASGKKIRVSGSVNASPRPKARPSHGQPPAEMLVAMQSGIDAALAEVAPAADAQAEAVADAVTLAQTTEPQPETLALAATMPPPEPRPDLPADPSAEEAEVAAVAEEATSTDPEAGPVELAEAETAPETAPVTLAQETEPQPETLALAETLAEALPEADEEAEAAPEVLAIAGVRPEPKPEMEAPTEVLAEAPAAEETDPMAAAVALALAEALGAEEPDTAPEDEVVSADSVLLAGTTDPQPETVQLAAIALSPETAAEPEQPQPARILLASVDAPATVEQQQEVVMRVSTSGGRHFGINVGRYPSRYEAERVLLQTALAEIGTLDDALRKVVNRKGGFEATFAGLSEDQASLACRRLTARGSECTVLAP